MLVVERFFGGDVECGVVDSEGVEVAVVVGGVGVVVVHCFLVLSFTHV